MRLAQVVETSNAVARVSGRLEKIDRLASLLGRIDSDSGDELELAIAFLSGSTRQGRIGVGYASISQLRGAVAPAAEATLDLREVDALFARIAATTGSGSARERTRVLNELFSRATADEQDFLLRLRFGELRQG